MYIFNLIAFITVMIYGVFLFVKAILTLLTRIAYMKLRKEIEFDLDIQ